VSDLLAQVLVHEITHILERTDVHAASGVMKKVWDSGDYFNTSPKHLAFTGEDIVLIHSRFGLPGVPHQNSRLLRHSPFRNEVLSYRGHPAIGMNPDRLRQIEELYHSTREREGGERAAFLAEACRGDEELRREVESLLA
jgi:hypothetical protein